MVEDNEIYRFMSIYEFYELFFNKKLKLTKVNIQSDKNDGIESILNNLVSGISPTEYFSLKKSFDSSRKCRYITCWTQSFDSIAMWLLYSKNEESIRVKTRLSKLKETLLNFTEDYSCWTQWNRPTENMVLIQGMESVQEVEYKNIREVIEQIRKDISEFKKKNSQTFEIDPNYYKGKFIEDYFTFYDYLSNKYTCKAPIKDESYSFEQEVRGEVYAGLKVDEKSENDWNSKNDVERIPVKDDLSDVLGSVIYAPVNDDFIEEVCFDPRMPAYKREVIFALFNLKQIKITESPIFEPALPLLSE